VIKSCNILLITRANVDSPARPDAGMTSVATAVQIASSIASKICHIQRRVNPSKQTDDQQIALKQGRSKEERW